MGEGASLGTAYVSLVLNKTGYQQGLNSLAGSTTKSIGSITSAVSKLAGVGVGLYALKQAVMTVHKSFVDFDRDMHNIWTLTDQTKEQIVELSNELRNLAWEYNVTSSEAAKAMYQIYSATFYGADAMKILESSARGAAAGLTDVFTAANMGTTVLNAYGMEAKEIAHVNDLLFTAIRFGKTTYGELASQFGRLAGVAAPVGASIEEMAAAIATLTRQGIATDWAVTSLRQTLMKMLQPTKDLEKAIEDLGYSSGGAMIKAIGFANSIKQVTDWAARNNVEISKMFTNVRAVTAVLPLATTAAAGFAKDLDRMASAGGAADEAFFKQTQSWAYQLEILKTRLNDIGITLGKIVTPAIAGFMDGVLGLLRPIGLLAKGLNDIGGTLFLRYTLALATFATGWFFLAKGIGLATAAMGQMMLKAGLLGSVLRKLTVAGGAATGTTLWSSALLSGLGIGALGLGAISIGLKGIVDLKMELGSVTGADGVRDAIAKSITKSLGLVVGGAILGALLVGTAAAAGIGAIAGGVFAAGAIATIYVIHRIEQASDARAAEAEDLTEKFMARFDFTKEIRMDDTGAWWAPVKKFLDDVRKYTPEAYQSITAALLEFYDEIETDAETFLRIKPAAAYEKISGGTRLDPGATRQGLLPTFGDSVTQARKDFDDLFVSLNSGAITIDQAYGIWEELNEMVSEWSGNAEMAVTASLRSSDEIAALFEYMEKRMAEAAEDAVAKLITNFNAAKKAYIESAEGTLERAMAEKDLMAITKELAGYQELLGLDAEDLTGKWKEMADWLDSVGIKIDKIVAIDFAAQISLYQAALSEAISSGNIAAQVAALSGLQSIYGSMVGSLDMLSDAGMGGSEVLNVMILSLENLYGFTREAADGIDNLSDAIDDMLGAISGAIEELSSVVKGFSPEIASLLDVVPALLSAGDALGKVFGEGGLLEKSSTSKEAAEDAKRFSDFAAANASPDAAILAGHAAEAATEAAVLSTVSTIAGIATGLGAVLSIVSAVINVFDVFAAAEEQRQADIAAAAEELRQEILSLADSAMSAASALWDLAQQAESVQRLQSAWMTLQEKLISALFGFLWPIVGILEMITGSLEDSTDAIEEETEARRASLNVPTGYKVRRTEWRAATPGQPGDLIEDDSSVTDDIEETLTWWEEILLSFGAELEAVIAPFRNFINVLDAAWQSIAPAIIQGVIPVLETFGWALDQLGTWITDVFVDDMKRFFEGFGEWWTSDVDPFLKAEVFPKLAEWGLLLWGVLKKLVGFFETTIWPFIEKTLWPVIEKIGDRLATLLVKVIDKIIEHWPVIEAYILGAIDAWVASIEQQVDAFIEVADTAGALSEALDPYDLGIYDLKTAFGDIGVSMEALFDATKDVSSIQDLFFAMNSLGLSVNDVRSVMETLGLSAEDLGLILGSYQSSGSSATVPIIPPDSGYGGLTSAEIAEIIAAHGGFGGVMGSTGQWVPYSTWNGVPVEQLAKGGKLLTDGLVFGHKNEIVMPASVAPLSAGMGGGGSFGLVNHVTVTLDGRVLTKEITREKRFQEKIMTGSPNGRRWEAVGA